MKAWAFKIAALTLALAGITAGISAVYAATKTSLPVDRANDFVLEPGKMEIFLNPGETVTKYISITSRITDPTQFDVSVEDFKGSDDPNQPVVLLGDERGPASLKDFIKPELESFDLSFGEKETFAVTVSAPKEVEPRGYYGAVIVSSVPKPSNIGSTTSAIGTTKVVSRVGTLLLVRVNGQAKESGFIQDFKALGLKHWFYEKGPDGFEILFKNTGTVHLVPHGLITIKNLLGRGVKTLPVDAYFSLPDSVRYREVLWPDKGFMLGRYTANLSFYPGYGNANINESIAFWVIPWKILVGVLVAIFLVVWAVYFIATRFEFRRKR